MTGRLGEWILRPGDELKLQLPPMNAAPMFTETLELKREGTHLAIRAARNALIRWQAGIELPTQATVRPMLTNEFNLLVAEGALSHPLPMFMLTRAHLALIHLVQTVPGAAEALRAWAVERDRQDQAAAGGDSARCQRCGELKEYPPGIPDGICPRCRAEGGGR